MYRVIILWAIFQIWDGTETHQIGDIWPAPRWARTTRSSRNFCRIRRPWVPTSRPTWERCCRRKTWRSATRDTARPRTESSGPTFRWESLRWVKSSVTRYFERFWQNGPKGGKYGEPTCWPKYLYYFAQFCPIVKWPSKLAKFRLQWLVAVLSQFLRTCLVDRAWKILSRSSFGHCVKSTS